MGNLQTNLIHDHGVELEGTLISDSHGKIPLENATVCVGKRGIRIIFSSYQEKNISYDRIIEIISEGTRTTGNDPPETDVALSVTYLHGQISVLPRTLKFVVNSKYIAEMRDILAQHGMIHC